MFKIARFFNQFYLKLRVDLFYIRNYQLLNLFIRNYACFTYLFEIAERLFGKDWREGCLVLHEDSTLVWYSSPGDSSPAVGVRLKDCPEMIAAGQYCAQVPGRPDFPDGHSIKGAIAVGSRTRKDVHWFVCQSEEEMM